MKRMLSGIRDLWIAPFCLTERTLLQILLAVPISGQNGFLREYWQQNMWSVRFALFIASTTFTVVMTVFAATNIKKWNAEFHIYICDGKTQKAFTVKGI